MPGCIDPHGRPFQYTCERQLWRRTVAEGSRWTVLRRFGVQLLRVLGLLSGPSRKTRKESVNYKNVLVIDDEEHTRAIHGAILRHTGYAVLEAGTAEEGIQLAREHLPDLILMDISLPGITGWEATRRLKADSDTAEIPVVALTGFGLPVHRERSEAAGCAGYLVKPIDPKEVVGEVDRLLALGAEHAA